MNYILHKPGVSITVEVMDLAGDRVKLRPGQELGQMLGFLIRHIGVVKGMSQEHGWILGEILRASQCVIQVEIFFPSIEEMADPGASLPGLGI